MFDVILNKIKTAVDESVIHKLQNPTDECVVVKIEPKSYDGTVCDSLVRVVCVFKTYERTLECFDKICDALYELPEEDTEVLDVVLENTVIKYDTVTGMSRILGDFSIFTEGAE